MPTTDILYFVEHVARELDIACLIRHLAARDYGLDVQVGSLVPGAMAGVRAYRPRLVVVPYFNSRRGAATSELLRFFPGVPCVNLTFEQLLSRSSQKLKSPKDEAARRSVLHLVMGDFYRKFLHRYGVPPENIVAVGSLACQLYRDPYRRYYASRREGFARRHGLDPDKPWVFFPENFAPAFFSNTTIAGRVRAGCELNEVLEYVEFSRSSFGSIMPWCAQAADPGLVEVIIRPRPATAREPFIEAFRRVAGRLPRRHLHFIKEASVREWILASDVVISSYSTSLVEAAVAGKPVYLLAPEPIPDAAQVEWHELPPHLTNRTEFLELVRNVDRAEVSHRLADWAERNLLSAGDSIARTADVLASICQGRRFAPPPPPPLAPWASAKQTTKRWARKLDRPLQVFRPSKRRSPRSNLFENDRFCPEDVCRRTDAWARLLPQPSPHDRLRAA